MSKRDAPIWNRREFLKASVSGIAALPAVRLDPQQKRRVRKRTKVVLVKTDDRIKGVKEVMRLLDFPPMQGKKIFIKPNFNTADPSPASTHNDTLGALVQEIHERRAAEITVGERSGPPPTYRVLEDKGIPKLAQEKGFKIINFEELQEESWVHFTPRGSHWSEGFSVAKPAVDAEYIVSTCCLKTHQFGGVFTMSLKSAVGLTPKRLMPELHQSPNMRKMIAELNLAYTPRLIVLDGVEAFVDGGPSTGRKVQADVLIGGTDRVAVDAVGIAVLKELGSNEAIMRTRIFDQEQVQRAVELNLGVSSIGQIELVTPDQASGSYSKKLINILVQG